MDHTGGSNRSGSDRIANGRVCCKKGGYRRETYQGATDPVVNFAQLTQRAGNFLVAREEMPDFKWEDLKGKKVLGGRKGDVHISM